jgi:DNA-binding SARP family transcriptional activator
MEIRLLGKPRIEKHGLPVSPPRGRKAWGLLAYLALAERPPPRARLTSLLFSDADDPLGALRWSLAELRRALGSPVALRGDPPALILPDGARIDVVALGDPAGAGIAPADCEGELLEGMGFPDSPAFEAWLTHERRRLAAACQAVIHEAALERLAADDPAGAVELAARLVTLDPLDQASQELLVRSLARSGDRAGAERQAAQADDLLRRELGLVPGPELREAAGDSYGHERDALGDVAAAAGQLDAGRAALDAGAVEPGLQCLRMADAEAAASGDAALRARCSVALGSALVHAVRGRDEEGATRLHQALALAEAAGDGTTAGVACRELGYVDVQAGRWAAAGRWLTRATALAADDDERSAVLGVRGMALSDRAHYEAALRLLEESADLASARGRHRQAAWSLSLVGRVHLLRGDLPAAAAVLDRSLELVATERWTAFRPWPESLRAELLLRAGRSAEAAERLDAAFQLACRLGDPCWEATAARSHALVEAARGDVQGALTRLEDARTRATRHSDPYQWVHAQVLETLAALLVETDPAAAREVVDALAELAGRTGMRELTVRAHVHRARLGDAAALELAALLAPDIDNPALDELVASEIAAYA